jgi:hypothetical protein
MQAGLSAVVLLLQESPMSELKQVLAYAYVMLCIRSRMRWCSCCKSRR